MVIAISQSWHFLLFSWMTSRTPKQARQGLLALPWRLWKSSQWPPLYSLIWPSHPCSWAPAPCILQHWPILWPASSNHSSWTGPRFAHFSVLLWSPRPGHTISVDGTEYSKWGDPERWHSSETLRHILQQKLASSWSNGLHPCSHCFQVNRLTAATLTSSLSSDLTLEWALTLLLLLALCSERLLQSLGSLNVWELSTREIP